LETTASTTCKSLPAADGSSSYEGPDPPMLDWVITTWSNSSMGTSWEDWTKDCQARASQFCWWTLFNIDICCWTLLKAIFAAGYYQTLDIILWTR
jgi:hypothetical protein